MRIVPALLSLSLLGQPALAASPCTSQTGATPNALLELYTSEGCSSCPPAERWLSGLSAQALEARHIVPLAFHVDYWNSLGWRDPYSQAAFSARQRARNAHSGWVYTPQFMLDGADFRGDESALRAPPASSQATLRLTLDTRNPQRWQAEVDASQPAASPMHAAANNAVYVALYENGLVSAVGAGENAQRTLHHDYVVRTLAGPFTLAADGHVQQSVQFDLKPDWRWHWQPVAEAHAIARASAPVSAYDAGSFGMRRTFSGEHHGQRSITRQQGSQKTQEGRAAGAAARIVPDAGQDRQGGQAQVLNRASTEPGPAAGSDIAYNIVISNSSGRNPLMHSPIQDYLHTLHARLAASDGGHPATYIPELAKADPAWFGICLVTMDGTVYQVGDSARRFTIQSISKPFIYATALADRGQEFVTRKVGVEPSGDAFNSISLDPRTGAPLNPMINAGAIASTSLVDGADSDAQWQRIAESMGTFMGHDIAVDEAVYRSESETGFRNRAIAWMLKNFGIVDQDDPMPPLENYFRQCSILVDCVDLAFMAATLANGGVHPLTGQRALPAEHVERVLSVMATCGMYDYAGCTRSACRPKVASAAASSLCCRAASGSGFFRRRSTPRATACAVSRSANCSRATSTSTCSRIPISPEWRSRASTAAPKRRRAASSRAATRRWSKPSRSRSNTSACTAISRSMASNT
jgi:glutaminase A